MLNQPQDIADQMRGWYPADEDQDNEWEVEPILPVDLEDYVHMGAQPGDWFGRDCNYGYVLRPTAAGIRCVWRNDGMKPDDCA